MSLKEQMKEFEDSWNIKIKIDRDDTGAKVSVEMKQLSIKDGINGLASVILRLAQEAEVNPAVILKELVEVTMNNTEVKDD